MKGETHAAAFEQIDQRLREEKGNERKKEHTYLHLRADDRRNCRKGFAVFLFG